MHLMHLLKKIWESKFVATICQIYHIEGKILCFCMFFRAALPDLFKIICQSKIRRLRKQHRQWNENTNSLYLNFIGKKNVLLANFISICFLCETLFAEWGFEVSWLHPILPPPQLGVFLVQLLLLLNLPTCVCQRAFFDDKIWIDYKRMPSCKVYFSFLKKAGNLRGSNPRETTCRRKWKIRNRPISTHQCHFLPQLKACPKSAPFQFHTPSKLLSCEGGAPHVCI